MIYGSKVLTMTLAIVCVHTCSRCAYADVWGEKTYMNGGVIRMVTTCVPQYFARRGRGNGRLRLLIIALSIFIIHVLSKT